MVSNSLLLLAAFCFLATCQSQTINDLYKMKVPEAYDDIRLLASKQIRQDAQTLSYLNDLFSNLTARTHAQPQSIQRMLSTKGHKQKENAFEAEQMANVVLKATEVIMKTSANYPNSINQYKIPDSFCPKPYASVKCDPYAPYRTIDGSCNNLQSPWYGAAWTPYKRLLQADYDDGYNAMKQLSVVKGATLPNARLLSISLHKDQPTKSVWTNLVVSFGQTIAHDIGHSMAPSSYDGSTLTCQCGSPDPNCFSIPVPPQDYYFLQQGTQCIPFTRNAAAVKDYDCNFGPREQLNSYTSFLDLTYIYSNNPASRTLTDGLLSFSVNGAGEVIYSLVNPSSCPFNADPAPVMITGDINSEQNIYLTSVQTLFLRNHNQLAQALKLINPYWDDETLFQQARKINIAQFQHIVYNEYLPATIGPYTTKLFDLEPLTWGYYMGYNAEVSPSLMNEFVTAAFRLHNLISHEQCYADERLVVSKCHPLSTGFLNSTDNCWGLDPVLRGLVATPSQYTTPQINWYMNNVLLRKYSSIAVFNVQRGRDHGIRPYNDYRELCGLNRAQKFEELYNIPPAVRQLLSELYPHVDDIDLWSGMVSELPVKDGMIGHTASCIVAKQFADLKKGDRFYYEHGHSSVTRFTPDQLNFIRSTTLASILCRNVDLDIVTKWPLLIWDANVNPFINCEQLAYGSLTPWTDSRAGY